jgi:antitoxin YefM
VGQISIAEFRLNPAPHIEAACDNHAPLVVTRPDGASAVILAEEDYRGLVETLELLSSPANAERLRRSIRELDAGGGVSIDPTI